MNKGKKIRARMIPAMNSKTLFRNLFHGLIASTLLKAEPLSASDKMRIFLDEKL